MKTTLRIISAALLLATAACGADGITAPRHAPENARHDGLGYLGGGGRASAEAQPRVVPVAR